MTVIHIDSGLTATYEITGTQNSYILDPGSWILSASGPAISIDGPAANNELHLGGRLRSEGTSPALLVAAQDTAVRVAKTGFIDGGVTIAASSDFINHGHIVGDDAAIYLLNSTGRFINHGQVVVDDTGVALVQLTTSGAFLLENNGLIAGRIAMSLSAPDLTVKLGRSSEIYGDTGIFVSSSAGHSSEIINQGLVSAAGGYAFRGGAGDNFITNRGTIHGTIELGGGGDRFVDKGRFVGDIIGGAGDDIFVLKTASDILEEASGGNDTVKIAKSHTLADNIETLVALGGRNVALTGNDDANTLRGNGGRNEISGGEGDDTLTGGAGRDLFLYAKFDGGDTITDFKHGQDRIRIEGFAQFTSFSDLDIIKSGNDVRISFADENGADFILIENQKVDEFDKGDFLFG